MGGMVRATAHGDAATLSLDFKAQGEGELLMMALPHHLDPGHLHGIRRTKLRHNSLKGDMFGLLGESWVIHEALPDVGWGASHPIDASRVEDVRAALLADQYKLLLVPDPYGSGKELGAVGRLALIADELGEDEVASSIRRRLAAKLEEWLSGKGADPLMYEPSYGGLVSANGLADQAADFGGGWYNDHHFHYGYFLYAVAAVGRKDSQWLKKWSSSINHLVRDIANPSEADELYPTQRFKDWYVGHSWASGIFPSGSGRNQESVSEALNAWYGLSLYGLALGDAGLRDLGRLMLATELRSGARYWQIDEHSTIYPPEFAANGLAAVVWSTKVDRDTWFGSNVEYSYGIQAMPVTPVSELWLRPRWLAATESIWQPAMATAVEQWRGILLMMSAVNSPEAAWQAASTLVLFDNGNTKTNLLYWVATRTAASDGAAGDGTIADGAEGGEENDSVASDDSVAADDSVTADDSGEGGMTAASPSTPSSSPPSPTESSSPPPSVYWLLAFCVLGCGVYYLRARCHGVIKEAEAAIKGAEAASEWPRAAPCKSPAFSGGGQGEESEAVYTRI